MRRRVWEVWKKSRIFLDFASTRGAARGRSRPREKSGVGLTLQLINLLLLGPHLLTVNKYRKNLWLSTWLKLVVVNLQVEQKNSDCYCLLHGLKCTNISAITNRVASRESNEGFTDRSEVIVRSFLVNTNKRRSGAKWPLARGVLLLLFLSGPCLLISKKAGLEVAGNISKWQNSNRWKHSTRRWRTSLLYSAEPVRSQWTGLVLKQ